MTEAAFYNSINMFLESDRRKLKNLKGQYKTWQSAWKSLNSDQDVEKEWKNLSSIGAELILLEDKKYPSLLKEIADPPFGIYVVGSLPDNLDSALAIVGTRKATTEGKNIAKNFSNALTQFGLPIISGLALGIDAAAHEGCLDAQGKTVAVLANGIGHVYPRTNERLAKKIIDNGGAIISEYPVGSPPLPYRFLERNRIVAGLSRGTLVVEAPEHSGSLVTARLALEQNREVFVIPGPIAHPNYKLSNQLIRKGAELVTKPEEILESFGIETETKERKNIFETEEEKIIFAALEGSAVPLNIDKIQELTELEALVINRTLTVMILKNVISETSNGYTIK